MRYALTVGFAASLLAGTAGAADPAYSPRDFTGVWMQVKTEAPAYPYNAEYAALYKKRLEDDAAGKPYNDPAGRCITSGMPAAIVVGAYPWEIFQSAKQVTMLKENGNVRRIQLTRGHTDEDGPTFMGDAVGHWEGDALVVSTIGFRDDTVLERRLAPHSDAMAITERITRPSYGVLIDEMVIEDPKAFSRPYVAKVTFERKDDWELKEFVCQANNRYFIDKDGVARIVMPQQEK